MTSETKTVKAGKKPRRKKGDKTQFERFVETARKIGVDESPEAIFEKSPACKSSVGTVPW